MTKHQAIIKEFREAVEELNQVLQKPKDEFMRDSAIKRFELAFDLSWKTIKAHLEEQGVFCTSPIGCFKEAYRQGIIEFNEQWIELTKIRNKTVHTYDEKLAEEVYLQLPDALKSFQALLSVLERVF